MIPSALNVPLRQILTAGIVFFVFSADAQAAGIDCSKAASEDEVAICSSQELIDKDAKVSDAYDAARAAVGKETLTPVAKSLLSERGDCGDDTDCIADVLDKSLATYQEMAGETGTDATSGDVETLAYDNQPGMEISIASRSGIDTDQAKIVLKHTRDNAVSFCKDNVGQVTEACIATDMKKKLDATISANCPQKSFVSMTGQSYRFKGPNPKFGKTDTFAKYLIEDVKEGYELDGSFASGYDVIFGQFAALCPSLVRE